VGLGGSQPPNPLSIINDNSDSGNNPKFSVRVASRSSSSLPSRKVGVAVARSTRLMHFWAYLRKGRRSGLAESGLAVPASPRSSVSTHRGSPYTAPSLVYRPDWRSVPTPSRLPPAPTRSVPHRRLPMSRPAASPTPKLSNRLSLARYDTKLCPSTRPLQWPPLRAFIPARASDHSVWSANLRD